VLAELGATVRLAYPLDEGFYRGQKGG
jgi:hypothetical protein